MAEDEGLTDKVLAEKLIVEKITEAYQRHSEKIHKIEERIRAELEAEYKANASKTAKTKPKTESSE